MVVWKWCVVGGMGVLGLYVSVLCVVLVFIVCVYVLVVRDC